MGRPFATRSVRRHIVRLPAVDWPALTQGIKTEVRVSGRHADQRLSSFDPPEPFIGYYLRHNKEFRHQLFLLEARWNEPLGSISPDSLEREGFDTLPQFREYWRNRHHSAGFKPLSTVTVLRCRPFRDEDWPEQADRIMRRLYADYAA